MLNHSFPFAIGLTFVMLFASIGNVLADESETGKVEIEDVYPVTQVRADLEACNEELPLLTAHARTLLEEARQLQARCESWEKGTPCRTDLEAFAQYLADYIHTYEETWSKKNQAREAAWIYWRQASIDIRLLSSGESVPERGTSLADRIDLNSVLDMAAEAEALRADLDLRENPIARGLLRSWNK